MEGDLTVELEFGHGSTFFIFAAIERDKTGDPMTKRVLVVDDHDDNRQILHALLTSAGFDMMEAAMGKKDWPRRQHIAPT